MKIKNLFESIRKYLYNGETGELNDLNVSINGSNLGQINSIDICTEECSNDIIIDLSVSDESLENLSDGCHTFGGLYHQRAVLFATLVNLNKDKSWKSIKHNEGNLCFGGGWFVVGIDTPEGQYTYHYKLKYWDLFDCKELPTAPPWDGHSEKDVTRLLSLVNNKEDKKKGIGDENGN